MTSVRWGVLSTAAIARVVIEATRQARQTRFVAVASRDEGRARAFADELGLPMSFGSYPELLASDDVDAVYVALPVSLHTEWTVQALQAGKHVLCEKPFAMTAADAARCFDAASSADRLCVEGLMYRHHPQTALARQLVADGAIGELATMRSALSVSVPAGDIRRSPELGGGSLLDLGCYCTSASRLFAGEPERVYAEQVPGRPRALDLRFAATMRMPDGVLAQFDLGLDLPRRDELELIGTEGTLTVPDPWLCRTGYVELVRNGSGHEFEADPSGKYGLTRSESDAYRLEFEAASAAILDQTEATFGRADAVAQAAVLEALRRSSIDSLPVDLSRPGSDVPDQKPDPDLEEQP